MPEYRWGDRTIPIVTIDGALYALAGWDGEKYKHCWKVDPEDHNRRLGTENYVITPVIAPEPKK